MELVGWISLTEYGLIEALLVFVVLRVGRKAPSGAGTAEPSRRLIDLVTRVLLVVLSIPCFGIAAIGAYSVVTGLFSVGIPHELGLRRGLMLYTVGCIAPLVFWVSAAVLLVRAAIIVGRPAAQVQATEPHSTGEVIDAPGISPAEGQEPGQ